jgi:hypothetical protein
VLLTHCFVSDKIEENEMCGACNSDGGRERLVQGFDGDTRGKETTGDTQV